MEEIDKTSLLKELEKKDARVVALAYAYAINMDYYGIDVTSAWETAEKHQFSLSRAYWRGREDEYKSQQEQERKKGKWLYSDDLYETLVCSSCDFDTEDRVKYNYCPNCGARMVGVDNNVSTKE